MSDGDDGASVHQPAQRLADRFLEFAVERGGRLVEQKERRVLEERPRDGDALALAAGQLDAALADERAHAVRQILDKIAARRECRLEHIFVRGVRPAVADVLHDRAMKQRNVLRHDADGFPQALLRHPRDILAVDQDAAVLHVIEALQQREQRRLAAAGAADQADALAGPEGEVQVLENLLAVAIAEVDVLEFDAGAAPRQRRRFGMVAQIVRHQQCRQRLRKAGDMLGDVDQRDREIARGVQHRKCPACRSGPHRRWSPRRCCHSTIAQASRPSARMIVTTA